MPRVVVLALDNWLGAARLPRALKRAGFEVALLCYPNTLVSLTKFADDSDRCLPTDSAEVVAHRLVDLAAGAKLVIPADERALRFLQNIVEQGSRVPSDLISLARRSLPDPISFELGNDKAAATRFIDQLGFPTPKRRLIASRQELLTFVGEIGLPVVLKPLTGSAGEGIQVIKSPSELESASLPKERSWMVQQFIKGKPAAAASVALEGKCLGTLPFEKTLTHPGETGPATVATRLDNSEMHRCAMLFAKATKYTGFFSPGFLVEETTGIAYFLEVNARATPIVPCSGVLGLDLCKCLYARLVGAPVPKPDPNAPRVIAFYPQELHRDPNSPFRDLLLDEPVDDPAVHAAMERGIKLLAYADSNSMPPSIK